MCVKWQFQGVVEGGYFRLQESGGGGVTWEINAVLSTDRLAIVCSQLDIATNRPRITGIH